MESLGVNIGFLLIQVFAAFGWIIFSLSALFNLRNKKLNGTALALWVLIICALPVLGALAYWIVRPSGESPRN